MNSTRRRLYRERRRLMIAFSFAILGGFILLSSGFGIGSGVQSVAIGALAFATALTVLAVVFLFIAPSVRYALETTGLSLFVYSIILQRLPEMPFLGNQASLAAFAGFLLTMAASYGLVYGQWSDKYLRRKLHIDRSTGITRANRTQIWNAALPHPDQLDLYWDETVKSITQVPHRPNVMHLHHQLPNGFSMTQEFAIDQQNPGKSLKYHYSVIGAEPPFDQVKSAAIVLEQRGEEMIIHLRQERPDYPLRLALMTWIDDWGGRTIDRIVKQIESDARPLGHFPQPKPRN